MFKFIARRILETIPVLFVIITGSFFLMHAAPGGPFDAERRVTPEIQRNLEAHYGLDKPLWVQYTCTNSATSATATSGRPSSTPTARSTNSSANRCRCR